MADLSTLTTGDRTVEMLHPGNKKPVGIRVTLMHIDDDRLKKLRRAIIDEQIRKNQRGKVVKSEEIEDNKEALRFAAITGWQWYNPTGNEGDRDYNPDAMPSFNGGVPEYTRKNLTDITTKLPWFREQIDEELGDTEAFFQNSKPI